jgi:hypothetical protein
MVLPSIVVLAECFGFVVAVKMATTCTSLMTVPNNMLVGIG